MNEIDRDTILARFWAKVNKAGPTHPTLGTECWLWTASIKPQGYGEFWAGEDHVYAHRFAYVLLVGPIPAGLQIDHLCRVRRCVNPAHLQPVTQRENVLRGEGFSAANAAKAECPSGHPYAGGNLSVRKGGWRGCRECKRARDRIYRRSRRAIGAA